MHLILGFGATSGVCCCRKRPGGCPIDLGKGRQRGFSAMRPPGGSKCLFSGTSICPCPEGLPSGSRPQMGHARGGLPCRGGTPCRICRDGCAVCPRHLQETKVTRVKDQGLYGNRPWSLDVRLGTGAWAVCRLLRFYPSGRSSAAGVFSPSGDHLHEDWAASFSSPSPCRFPFPSTGPFADLLDLRFSCRNFQVHSSADYAIICGVVRATVAQLDRALASEAEGCWFDPSQSHQFSRILPF